MKECNLIRHGILILCYKTKEEEKKQDLAIDYTEKGKE